MGTPKFLSIYVLQRVLCPSLSVTHARHTGLLKICSTSRIVTGRYVLLGLQTLIQYLPAPGPRIVDSLRAFKRVTGRVLQLKQNPLEKANLHAPVPYKTMISFFPPEKNLMRLPMMFFPMMMTNPIRPVTRMTM